MTETKKLSIRQQLLKKRADKKEAKLKKQEALAKQKQRQEEKQQNWYDFLLSKAERVRAKNIGRPVKVEPITNYWKRSERARRRRPNNLIEQMASNA